MIAQWNSSLSVLPVARVQFPTTVEYFKGFFPMITLCQPVLSQRGRKWLNLLSKTPHNLWTVRKKAKVQPWIGDG